MIKKKKTSSIFFLDGYWTLETYTGFLLSAEGAEVQNTLDFQDRFRMLKSGLQCDGMRRWGPLGSVLVMRMEPSRMGLVPL